MMSEKKKISVLIFTYNRTGYLAECLYRFLTKCQFPREQMEILVSDDGSDSKHLNSLIQVCDMFNVDKLYCWNHGGQGASNNNAIRIAQGEYILHLQNDFGMLNDDVNCIQKCVDILDNDPQVACVGLFDLLIYPQNQRIPYVVKTPNGPIRLLWLKPPNKYVYSDGPHIKRTSFHHEFGWYLEGQGGPKKELDFSQRFQQSNWKYLSLGKYFQDFGLHSFYRSTMENAHVLLADHDIPIDFDLKEWEKRHG